MEWTPAQKRTIEEKDKNILVSAAAGSGKTAVLIERIIRLVLDEKTSIDQFLITTFTEAAAAEMRERLEKAIMKELQKPQSDKAYLRKQLSLLPNASISTVHKFALDVIRNFFYLTDLEPGFRVCDEIQGSLMQREAIDELFEGRFEESSGEKGEAFFDFLKRRSGDRSDERLKKSIMDAYKALRSIPYYMDWAKESTEKLNAEDPLQSLGLYDVIFKEAAETAAKAEASYSHTLELANPVKLPNICSKLNQEFIGIQSLNAAVKETYIKVNEGQIASRDAFQQMMDSFNEKIFVTLRTTKDDDNDLYEEIKADIGKYRDAAKKGINKIKDKYFIQPAEAFGQEIRDTYEDTSYFTGLIEEYESILKAHKAKENCIDFDDIMHYAIQILGDEKAAEEYKHKFAYIFVDEYQDSNQLQEEIVQRISRGNNVFMVGDVKQSIYKFRLAEPELFLQKYEEFKAEEKTDSIKIDLNSNFRSKKMVTETVNRVFEEIMPGYDENAKLHCSIPEEYPGLPAKMHIINKEGIDEEFMDDSLAEAEVTVQLIRSILGKEIYDSKDEVYKTVGYGDIAVLSRGGRVLADMERYLNNAGIPAYAQNSDGYYETVEVQVFINILHIIDNLRQDVPLISAMRSVVFGFAMKELADIRIHCPQGSFYSAVKEYKSSGDDEGIRAKIDAMMDQIRLWKEIQKTAPLDELLRMVMYDTGYYNYCSGLPAGSQRVSNLRILLEKAAAYEEQHYDGLYGFLRYIEAMKESNQKVGEASMSGGFGDTVNLMTVHKSKGLEFPIVILVGCGRQTGGSASASILHKSYAIGLPLISQNAYVKKRTLLQQVISNVQSREGLDEEIRILYVALTRAKDQLITVGTMRKMDRLEELQYAADTGSYLEMMYKTFFDAQQEEPSIASITIHDTVRAGQADEGWPAEEDTEEACGTTEAAPGTAEEAAGADGEAPGSAGAAPGTAEEAGEPQDEGLDAFVDSRLSYEYPYAPKDGSKPKYSVSELNRRQENSSESTADKPDNIPLSELQFTEQDDRRTTLNAAQIGTAMHFVMERLDFAKAMEGGEPYIRDFVHELAEKGLLSEEEHKAVNCRNIAGFFLEETGKRAAKAFEEGKLQKETEFILRKEVDGEKAIVQGIIDCFFEEEDGLVLIDYKNSGIFGERTLEEVAASYRGQIQLYKEALEEATAKTVKEAYLFLFKQGCFLQMD